MINPQIYPGSARLNRQAGQASLEYAIVCAALAFALGVGMIDSNSVLWQLIDAFKVAYHKYSYSLSLPI
ncbi:hypothetical protein SAMN04515617_1078 [Collimonas sp. OK242]|jgi:hypothetical protein|uniref:hypothetical protein n=1 Tax=Collimonas sp. OK242 TaxID=1798195 RepID=UPI0008989655|nr:hypothetical protein [Collimonas sp. OK242]SDX79968.1 hypothetical protein SAMN04515617_1078 [Collimonas sp. OK242]